MNFDKNVLFILKLIQMEKQPLNIDEAKEIPISEVKKEEKVENKDYKPYKCDYDDWFGEFSMF